MKIIFKKRTFIHMSRRSHKHNKRRKHIHNKLKQIIQKNKQTSLVFICQNIRHIFKYQIQKYVYMYSNNTSKHTQKQTILIVINTHKNHRITDV